MLLTLNKGKGNPEKADNDDDRVSSGGDFSPVAMSASGGGDYSPDQEPAEVTDDADDDGDFSPGVRSASGGGDYSPDSDSEE